MPLEFKLDLTIPKIALFNTRRVDNATRQAIYPAMTEATLLLEREVKQRTPVGATEAARGSIQSGTELVRGRVVEVRGTVTSALGYMIPLEQGTRPHWVPIAPLKLWAKRVLGDERLAYAVRATIKKRGTKGAHMFRDGFEASKGKLERILQHGIDEWVRLLKRR